MQNIHVPHKDRPGPGRGLGAGRERERRTHTHTHTHTRTHARTHAHTHTQFHIEVSDTIQRSAGGGGGGGVSRFSCLFVFFLHPPPRSSLSLPLSSPKGTNIQWTHSLAMTWFFLVLQVIIISASGDVIFHGNWSIFDCREDESARSRSNIQQDTLSDTCADRNSPYWHLSFLSRTEHVSRNCWM